MSAPRQAPSDGCRVVAAEKLPSGVGESSTICIEVERAIAALAPNVRFSAEIKVLSTSRLVATLVVNGRTLPEQKFAVSDRELNPGSIRRFAHSLAAAVAAADRR
jgi:hypothetical protein